MPALLSHSLSQAVIFVEKHKDEIHHVVISVYLTLLLTPFPLLIKYFGYH